MNREEFLRLVGKLPKKVDLNSKIISEVEYEKYVMQKICFDSEIGDTIPAYILIPKGNKRAYPAIYCHHQHASNWDIGKSEVVGLKGDPDMAYAKELAERGFITFAPDSIAFEERQSAMGGTRGNYFELAKRLLIGENLLAKTLFDISRGIDYLESRKEVNNAHIGFIGHSYGGRMALFSPAFDKRITASVSNCGCISYKNSIDHKVGIQLEFCVPNFLCHGDVEDVVRLINPCSLLISATEDDKYSTGAMDLFKKAKDSFKDGELLIKIYKGDHVFTRQMRDVAYLFLEKHLMQNAQKPSD